MIIIKCGDQKIKVLRGGLEVLYRPLDPVYGTGEFILAKNDKTELVFKGKYFSPTKWRMSRTLRAVVTAVRSLAEQIAQWDSRANGRQALAYASTLELLYSILNRFNDFNPVIIPLLSKILGEGSPKTLLDELFKIANLMQRHTYPEHLQISALTCRIASVIAGIIASVHRGNLGAFDFRRRLEAHGLKPVVAKSSDSPDRLDPAMDSIRRYFSVNVTRGVLDGAGGEEPKMHSWLRQMLSFSREFDFDFPRLMGLIGVDSSSYTASQAGATSIRMNSEFDYRAIVGSLSYAARIHLDLEDADDLGTNQTVSGWGLGGKPRCYTEPSNQQLLVLLARLREEAMLLAHSTKPTLRENDTLDAEGFVSENQDEDYQARFYFQLRGPIMAYFSFSIAEGRINVSNTSREYFNIGAGRVEEVPSQSPLGVSNHLKVHFHEDTAQAFVIHMELTAFQSTGPAGDIENMKARVKQAAGSFPTAYMPGLGLRYMFNYADAAQEGFLDEDGVRSIMQRFGDDSTPGWPDAFADILDLVARRCMITYYEFAGLFRRMGPPMAAKVCRLPHCDVLCNRILTHVALP